MKIVFLNTLDAELREPLRIFLQTHIPDTDVFCFQETYRAMRTLIGEVCGDYQVITDTKPVHDHDFTNTTLVKNGIEIIATNSTAPLLGTGLTVLSTVRYQDTLVHIANLHGLSRPGKLDTPERLQQSKEILDMVEPLAGAKIIGGDLNVLLDTQSVEMFEAAGYRNLIKDFAIPTTRNHIAWDQHPGNELMYSDYVFTTGVAVTDFVVPSEIVSDHQPMIVTLDLNA